MSYDIRIDKKVIDPDTTRCIYDAFEECYICTCSAYSVGNNWRRTNGVYDLVKMEISFTLNAKSNLLHKFNENKATEEFIAAKLTERKYLSSLIEYIKSSKNGIDRGLSKVFVNSIFNLESRCEKEQIIEILEKNPQIFCEFPINEDRNSQWKYVVDNVMYNPY